MQAQVIEQLLDVAQFSGKPFYNMASELPVCVMSNLPWQPPITTHIAQLALSITSHRHSLAAGAVRLWV